MLEWYEQDPIFSVFGNAKTKEAFAQHWVVQGHFHDSVPEDIVKSYKTVEYLMAHAWYHWPMFDEALSKLSGMVEMAVKQRSVDLEIDLTYEYTDKGGKQRKGKKNFYRLIEDLSCKEPKKELKNWLHDVRWLRNHFAHRDGKTLMGGLVISKIKNIVNLVNLIFLDEADSIAAKEKTALFKVEYADFKEGLFVMECNGLMTLVTEIKVLEVFQVKADWIYVCFLRPMLNTPPTVLALKQIGLDDGVFEAADFETGLSVKVLPTTYPEHQQVLSKYLQDWDQLDQVSQSNYNAQLVSACGSKIRDFMHQYRWTT